MEYLRQCTRLVDAILSGNYSHEQILDLSFIIHGIFTFGYFVSALVLYSNVYAGFNGIFLGLVVIGFTIYGYRVLRHDVNRTSYGIILGGNFILVFILLQSAIFWGQYSGCVPYNDGSHVSYGVDCRHRRAMESICSFSVLLFISYGAQIAVMIKHKNDILGSAPSYEYSRVPTNIPSAPIYSLPSPRHPR